MEAQANLRSLYESQLLPALEKLEKERITVRNRGFVVIVFLVIAIFVTSVNEYHYIKLPYNSTLLTILSWLLTLAALGYANMAYGPYKRKYKRRVAKPIFELISNGMKYNPKNFISLETYQASKIFRKNVDRYSGDDHLSGKVDNVDYQFSEIHSEYVEVYYHKGKRREAWHTIFKGIFIAAEFNKNIKHETYVLPDFAEKHLGRLGKFFQKNSLTKHAKELIKLENPDFESEFVVYGDDQIESRYVLTPKIMESILAIKNNFGRNIHVSFIGNHVYIAISLFKNMFEPSIFRSRVNYSQVAIMAGLINTSLEIVKDLELNNDIWGKQA